MRIRSLLISLVAITVLAGASWFVYKKITVKKTGTFFRTQKAERRNIYKIVNAEGTLEAQGTSKIGSLISAKVKKIYVKDGQHVEKGTLLADLENDKGGDTDLRNAAAVLKKAQATLTYATANYKREQALFKSGQRSADSFEKTTAEYTAAQADVEMAQAHFDKEQFLFEQTHVQAPHEGIIISIPTKEGQAFSPFTSPPQVLFEIAQDLGAMKATLLIDENKIGDIKPGMQAKITVDAHPYQKPWKGTITTLGLGRTWYPSPQGQQGISYAAEVILENKQGLLRPDMTVHAKITIAKAKQTLAVPGFVFQLNAKVLEGAANVMQYSFVPLDPVKKKELIKLGGEYPVKTLWVVENRAIVEKAVSIGVTDNAYFQIVTGLDGSEDIIADDMTASDELKRIAKQIAGS